MKLYCGTFFVFSLSLLINKDLPEIIRYTVQYATDKTKRVNVESVTLTSERSKKYLFV